MKRLAAGPLNLADLETKVTRATGDRDWNHWTLADNSAEAGMLVGKAGAGYLQWPDGMNRAIGQPGELEWHPDHEEAFILSGTLHMERGHSFKAPAYFNHPPYWVHPTTQKIEGQVTILVHSYWYPVTSFDPMPDGWQRRGFFAAGAPSRSRPVDCILLDELPWQAVTYDDGTPTGVDARHIWDDADDPRATWMMRVPAGWHGRGDRREMPGGDAIFVLEGDLAFDCRGLNQLKGGSYVSDPHRFVDGGSAMHSENGCVAIRWTTGGNLTLPPISEIALRASAAPFA